jgi:hypothetical protein
LKRGIVVLVVVALLTHFGDVGQNYEEGSGHEAAKASQVCFVLDLAAASVTHSAGKLPIKSLPNFVPSKGGLTTPVSFIFGPYHNSFQKHATGAESQK